jgi:DNA-binding GntR family transcriptional regulator
MTLAEGHRPIGRQQVTDSLFAELNQQPLSRTVLDAVRNAIVSGKLKPGEQLVQSQIASQLGTSRAPVREALNRLEEEGLVINLPYKGTVVAPLTRQDIDELRSLRLVLERYAASLMIERITDSEIAEIEAIFQKMRDAANRGDSTALDLADLEIHTRICELSEHKLLFEVWKIYVTRYRRVLALRNKVNRDLHAIVDMHIELIDALRARDRVALDRFYDNHGVDVTRVLTETFPEYFEEDGPSAGVDNLTELHKED